jgi:serine/threonine-protein kinase RsbW
VSAIQTIALRGPGAANPGNSEEPFSAWDLATLGMLPMAASLALARSMQFTRADHASACTSISLCRTTESSRVFGGTVDQVRAAREFTRAQLGEHSAADDAVAIVSELAANAVSHTSSGRPGGRFLVRLTILSAHQAVIMVTDQGSLREPQLLPFEQDRESGRGLQVVSALANAVVSFGDSSGRTVLAITAAHPDDQDSCRDQERASCQAGHASD